MGLRVEVGAGAGGWLQREAKDEDYAKADTGSEEYRSGSRSRSSVVLGTGLEGEVSAEGCMPVESQEAQGMPTRRRSGGYLLLSSAEIGRNQAKIRRRSGGDRVGIRRLGSVATGVAFEIRSRTARGSGHPRWPEYLRHATVAA